MAIVTSGSYTVGTSADYPTWGGAAGAVANIGNLTANLTFTQTTVTTETAAAAVYNKAIGNYTLTYDSNVPHLGDPTGGLVTSVNYGGGTFFIHFSNCTFGTGHIRVKNLYLKQIGPSIGQLMQITHASGVGRYYWEDILIDSNNLNNRGIYLPSANVDVIYKFKNINIWDNVLYAYDAAACTGDLTIENCNAYRGGSGFHMGNQAHTLNNCTGCDNVTNDFLNVGNATGNNNSSTGSTANNFGSGSGNIINQVTSACVQSLDDTSDDFFSILSAGPWDGTGITNTIDRTTDIRGITVPGINGTSIGVSETPGTFNLNLGNSNIDVADSFDSSVYNTGSSILRFQSSDWTVGDNWTYGSNTSAVVGTSAITFTNTPLITTSEVALPHIILQSDTTWDGGSTIDRMVISAGVQSTFDNTSTYIVTNYTAADINYSILVSDVSGTQYDLDFPAGGISVSGVSATDADSLGGGEVTYYISNVNNCLNWVDGAAVTSGVGIVRVFRNQTNAGFHFSFN